MPLVITGLEHREEDFPLDQDVVRGLWEMEDRHFWHEARNQWIARLLREKGVVAPAACLDVGCGSGAVARFLHRAGYRVTGVDTAEPLVRKAHERCPEAIFVVGSLADLPVGGQPFRVVGMFDVLEHLDDPLSLLRQALKYARPGALVLATVPAQQALFSFVDEASGHKRRYELGELAELFREAGLQGVEERGIFRLTQPLLRNVRLGRGPASLGEDQTNAILIKSFRVPPRPLNVLLRHLCSLERMVGYSRSLGRQGATLLVCGAVP